MDKHAATECKGRFTYGGTAKTGKIIMICRKCGTIRFV